MEMVRNLLSPIVGRDGTREEDLAKESQTVFGKLPVEEAKRVATSQLL